MSILGWLVDTVVMGYKYIVNVLDWVGAIGAMIVFLCRYIYPFSLVVPVGLSIITIKFILRGGK